MLGVRSSSLFMRNAYPQAASNMIIALQIYLDLLPFCELHCHIYFANLNPNILILLIKACSSKK